MVFRVRHGDGDYVPVRIAPGAQGIEAAIAGRVGLTVGSFFIKDATGMTSAFDGDLDGDWDVVLLPVQAAPARAVAGPAGKCA